MPQMMPINWIISLMFFIMTFILFNIVNFYIFQMNLNNPNKPFTNKTHMSMKYPNWKW